MSWLGRPSGNVIKFHNFISFSLFKIEWHFYAAASPSPPSLPAPNESIQPGNGKYNNEICLFIFCFNWFSR